MLRREQFLFFLTNTSNLEPSSPHYLFLPLWPTMSRTFNPTGKALGPIMRPECQPVCLLAEPPWRFASHRGLHFHLFPRIRHPFLPKVTTCYLLSMINMFRGTSISDLIWRTKSLLLELPSSICIRHSYSFWFILINPFSPSSQKGSWFIGVKQMTSF